MIFLSLRVLVSGLSLHSVSASEGGQQVVEEDLRRQGLPPPAAHRRGPAGAGGGRLPQPASCHPASAGALPAAAQPRLRCQRPREAHKTPTPPSRPLKGRPSLWLWGKAVSRPAPARGEAARRGRPESKDRRRAAGAPHGSPGAPSGGAAPRPRGPCPDGRQSWYIRVCRGRQGEGWFVLNMACLFSPPFYFGAITPARRDPGGGCLLPASAPEFASRKLLPRGPGAKPQLLQRFSPAAEGRRKVGAGVVIATSPPEERGDTAPRGTGKVNRRRGAAGRGAGGLQQAAKCPCPGAIREPQHGAAAGERQEGGGHRRPPMRASPAGRRSAPPTPPGRGGRTRSTPAAPHLSLRHNVPVPGRQSKATERSSGRSAGSARR